MVRIITFVTFFPTFNDGGSGLSSLGFILLMKRSGFNKQSTCSIYIHRAAYGKEQSSGGGMEERGGRTKIMDKGCIIGLLSLQSFI